MLVLGTLNDGSEVEVDIGSNEMFRVHKQVIHDFLYDYLLSNSVFDKKFTVDEKEKFVALVLGLKDKYDSYSDCDNEDEAIKVAIDDPMFSKYRDEWADAWVD